MADKWEAVRAEVIARSSGQCANCGTDHQSLHVHHRFYESGKAKWDYPIDSFTALCPLCHARADALRRDLVRSGGLLDEPDAMRAIGYMQALTAEFKDYRGHGSIKILSWEHAHGVAQVFGLTVDDIPIEHWNSGSIPMAWLLRSSAFRYHRARVAAEVPT